MITPLQREKVQNAARIAASAARTLLAAELEDWRRSANPILAQAAADELSRRRDLPVDAAALRELNEILAGTAARN